MPGYKRPPLLLTFTNPEFEGLEVRCRRPSVGDILDLAQLRGITSAASEADIQERVDALMTRLASLIVSWNLLDDNDEPVKITAESIAAQDFYLMIAITGALLDASGAGVRPPLPRPSDDGAPSLAASIPMETLSESPPS